MMKELQNYMDLIRRVDERCQAIADNYGRHMACKKGCDGCCRHLTLFPVEAAALAAALDRLPEDRARHIRRRAKKFHSREDCPLLEDGLCLLYAARPIICRTHGLPILVREESGPRLDVCPLNFKNLSSLPGDAVMDLERLNTALIAVNRLFLSEDQKKSGRLERLPMAEVLSAAEMESKDPDLPC